MKRAIAGLSIILFFFGFVPLTFSANASKIGVFSFQKILVESSAGKLTQKEVSTKGTELQNKLKAEKDQLDELQKAFEREALVLSPEKQQEKQRDFRIRVNDFKKMQQDFTQQFKKLEVDLINKIQKDVFEITTEMGKQGGYLLIMERKTSGIMYHPENIDITDEIIKRYNLKVSKAK